MVRKRFRNRRRQKTAPPASVLLRAERRRWAMRAAAIAVGLAIGLAVTEAALRALGIRPERYAEPIWTVWHEGRFVPLGPLAHVRRPSPFYNLGVTAGEYIPGVRFKQQFASNPSGYFDTENCLEYRINSLGLRGPEVTPEKPPTYYRILAVGDSFTFGVGVKEPDTFTRRLERSLNAEYRGSPRFEAINAGVQGYNTRDEVVNLEKRWLQLKPDLVLLFFYLNDAYNDQAIRNMGQELGIHRPPTKLGKWWYTYDLVQHAWQTRKDRRELENLYRKSFFKEADKILPQIKAANIDWTDSWELLSIVVF